MNFEVILFKTQCWFFVVDNYYCSPEKKKKRSAVGKEHFMHEVLPIEESHSPVKWPFCTGGVSGRIIFGCPACVDVGWVLNDREMDSRGRYVDVLTAINKQTSFG